MLDCAAHMLLYFDEPRAMQQIGLRHLLERFQAARGAVIYGTPLDGRFRVYVAERRADEGMPPVSNIEIGDHPYVLGFRWDSNTVTVDAPACEPVMRAAPESRPLAQWLEQSRGIFGLVFMERRTGERSWLPAEQEYFSTFARDFLSPLLGASGARLEQLTRLTKAELAVLRLAVHGLSYKRIAAELGKSPNTVDNQLRQLREKFGAHNQLELLRACEAVL
jgi:DNA-binding CsgD family transcriptional regulator